MRGNVRAWRPSLLQSDPPIKEDNNTMAQETQAVEHPKRIQKVNSTNVYDDNIPRTTPTTRPATRASQCLGPALIEWRSSSSRSPKYWSDSIWSIIQLEIAWDCNTSVAEYHNFSYVPSSLFSKTVNPADLAAETESGFVILGVLIEEINFRTGFLHIGHAVRGALSMGRLNSKPSEQTLHPLLWSSDMYS